jgi:hypothetical protein
MRARAAVMRAISMVALCAAAATPALATGSPPPDGLRAAPPLASLQGLLGRCADASKPSSGFGAGSAQQARRTGVLHGRATGSRCGVATVTVSIARVRGKQCRLMTDRGRLSPPASCSARRFLVASGTSDWHLELPKRLPHGSYMIRTRAVDFAGNVQQSQILRLKVG